jgi:hypothetical protein
MTFDDAMTLHVLRAQGFTYAELTGLFGDHPTRIASLLDGTLHPGSWEAALERLRRGHYWHPRIAAIVLATGVEPIIAATEAADPARRRFRRSVKRAHKFSIPFCRPGRLPNVA